MTPLAPPGATGCWMPGRKPIDLEILGARLDSVLRRALSPPRLAGSLDSLRSDVAQGGDVYSDPSVEAMGIEPTTSCMPCKRSTN